MSSTILQSYFTEHFKKLHEDYKKLFKMFGEVSISKKPIKVEVEGEGGTITLNKRKVTAMLNSLHNTNAPVNKLFKLANKGINLRHAPVFLTKDTINFFKDAKKIIGADVMSNLSLFGKYGLIEQRSLDVLWNIYVNKQELYKKATQNIERVKKGEKESRQYIGVDARIKKFLRVPLQGLVTSFKGKKYTKDDINFKGGKETVDGLMDFKFFHFSRVKKNMVFAKLKLNKTQKALVTKPKNNKIFKEYEKLIYRAKIDADLKGEPLDSSVFVDAAVKVSQMDLKVGTETVKIGPYTQKQIEDLDVDATNGSTPLAIRSLLDREILILKKIKADLKK